jgi:hypothetical protein
LVLIEIRLDNSEVQRLYKNLDKYSEQVRKRVSDQIGRSAYNIHAMILRYWKFNLKTTSRRLESSLRVILHTAQYWAEVATEYFVAPFIEQGTKPHTIQARNKKILAVQTSKYRSGGIINAYGSGQLPAFSKDRSYIIFGRRVSHPGTIPHPGMKSAADTERPKYIQAIINILNKK